MNKLVSKNSVLRFRLGKLIRKVYYGYKTEHKFADGSTMATPSQASAQGRFNRQIANGERSPYYVAPWQYLLLKEIPVEEILPTETSPESEEVVKKELPKKLIVRKTTPATSFYGTRVGGLVRARGNNFSNMYTEDLKNALLNTGRFTNEDFANVTSFQNALNRYFAEDAKQGAGSISADGKWGNQTQKAFDMALSKAKSISLPTNKDETLSAIGNMLSAQPRLTPEISTTLLNPIINNAPKNTVPWNRSQTRDIIRQAGYGAYGDFSGVLRKALRQYLNGEEYNKDLLQGYDLSKFDKFKLKTGGTMRKLQKGDVIKNGGWLPEVIVDGINRSLSNKIRFNVDDFNSNIGDLTTLGESTSLVDAYGGDINAAKAAISESGRYQQPQVLQSSASNVPAYTRKDIRKYLRSQGVNPYSLSGALRRALGLLKNGQSGYDPALLLGLEQYTTPAYRKSGGRLISKNPVKRFKQNKRFV